MSLLYDVAVRNFLGLLLVDVLLMCEVEMVVFFFMVLFVGLFEGVKLRFGLFVCFLFSS